MPQISVTIDGKTYRMACDEGQEDHLTDLAARFDRYVTHLKGSFGEIGDQRLTVVLGEQFCRQPVGKDDLLALANLAQRF